MKPNFPFIVQSTITRLVGLVDQDAVKHGRAGIWRAMRKERREGLVLLLMVLVKAAAMQFDGAAVKIIDKKHAFPLTVADMARLSKQGKRRVERELEDLRNLGLISSSQQVRRQGPFGLECGPVLRCFTRKFWELLGLWSQFVESVKYATKYGSLTLVWKFVRVANNYIHNLKKITGELIEREKKRKNSDLQSFVKQRNLWFMQIQSCFVKHGSGCNGGFMADDACKFCKNICM